MRQQLRWKEGLKVKDQLRLWFPTTWNVNAFFYTHILDDKVRIHYDNGLTRIHNYDINFYGSIDFLKNWTNLNTRVGFSHENDKAYTNTRLRIDDDKTLTLYHKTLLRLQEWKLGFVLVAGLNNNVSLLKKDIAIGYQYKDFNFYLKGLQAWDRKTNNYNNWREFFSTVSLTTLYHRSLR